jgi:hypothetical protein
VLREADDEDRALWRAARRRSGVASTLRAAWGVAVFATALLLDGDLFEPERPGEPGATAGASRGRLLVGTLDGTLGDRLRVDGSRITDPRTVSIPGRVSSTKDGILWQPDDQTRHGALLREPDLEEIVVGLPGRGLLVRTTDGRIGFTLQGRRAGDLLAAIDRRYRSPEEASS